MNKLRAFLQVPQVLVASEGEVAEEDEGLVDDVGIAQRAVRRTQGSLAAMSGAGGLVRPFERGLYLSPVSFDRTCLIGRVSSLPCLAPAAWCVLSGGSHLIRLRSWCYAE